MACQNGQNRKPAFSAAAAAAASAIASNVVYSIGAHTYTHLVVRPNVFVPRTRLLCAKRPMAAICPSVVRRFGQPTHSCNAIRSGQTRLGRHSVVHTHRNF